ncbi:zinc finger protein 665-like isoform X2 [Toxorhynchites rutilus septentrionalis]|uniref:zinc finger protein 665-like isoform X2 n=1 Tax=Toxorhynchites rutilus septentrionalis TaxID=329112 RepID=UPI002478A94B|nr:zinc finger protein 665-like isoform X2 [Toxorhynchites rutilus septentrionalis]
MSSIKTFLEVQRLEADSAKSDDVLSDYTSVRLQILLKYLRINPELLRDPVSFPRTLHFIGNDLARSGLSQSSEEVYTALEHWKERIFNSDQASLTIPPDRELKRLLLAIESRLTHSQITLILQHMEVVGSHSQTLWPTIAVEMKALKFPPRPEIYWRWAFEQWCQEARKRFEDDPDGLSSLQQRYIDFLRERNELEQQMAAEENVFDALELIINHCRACLETLKVGNPKVYLFEALGVGTTLADKINVCFGSGIDIEDRLPKYVCGECVAKVDVAYTLKMQIDRTDEELRSLMAEYNRKSNAEQREVEEQVHILEETELPIDSIVVMSEQIQSDEIEFQTVVVDMVDERDGMIYDDDREQQSDSRSVDKDEECSEIMAEGQDYSGEQEEVVIAIKEEDHKFSTDDSSDYPAKSSRKSRNKIVPEIDKKFYRCNLCRTILRTSDLWRAHMDRHASEKEHVCSTCSKQFRSASTLKVHQRTHTNERPYVCDICNKSFAQNTNLVYHLKVHQNIRDFPCDQCPYRARSQNDLNLHQRKHTGVRPYTCGVCQCSFTTSSNLNKHAKRRHMGERKYKCEECGKTFTTKETVQKHMVTHNGTKPYSCPECKVPYSWYNGLQKHMKLIHPGAHIPTEKTLIDEYNEAQKRVDIDAKVE